MKKPRKEMRMNRRKMKAEINRLHRLLMREVGANRVHVETYRVERVVNIFDLGSKEHIDWVRKRMAEELCDGLLQNGCITFTMTEEPRVCGVKITADIKTVRQ